MPAIAANDDDNDDHSLSCCIPSPPSHSRPPTPPPAPRRLRPTTARLEPPLRTASPNRQAKMSGIIQFRDIHVVEASADIAEVGE